MNLTETKAAMRLGRGESVHENSLLPAMMLLWMMMCCSLGIGQPALARQDESAAAAKDAAPTTQPAQEKLDPRSQAVWSRYWQKAAANYIKFNGEYLCIRGYNERYPSSKGVTVNDLLRRDKGYVMRLRTRRGNTAEQRVSLSRAEAEALAMVLPELAVGNYGFIHSVEVERILGPTSMIVRSIWLVDAQAVYRARDDDRSRLMADYDGSSASQLVDELYQNRIRLVDAQQQAVFSKELVLEGFPTDQLASGMRWRGPGEGGLQIAILAVRDIQGNGQTGRGHRRMLVAAPVGRLRTGLNREEFDQLLAQRKMTHKDLVAVIDDASRGVLRDVEKSMIDAIEAKAPAQQQPDEPDAAQ
jgi:hypothetical protein